MRLLTTALTNSIWAFGAEKGQQFAASSKHLQEACVRAASSRSGRDVVLNSVAVVYKVVQALNAPETKVSNEAVASYAAVGVIDMAASPEASIFLAELATNLLYTIESEERRQECAQEEEEELCKWKGKMSVK
ncbi:hypothetical protein PsorP6_012735 [Peronosclerospora sorghi]|uniref:Uncharacterized protein n=1 Tax=Peronosclerospora sorghi TaxID=230839 RepID=A0ACC0WJV5_9STRA|nr:hypothetical protein PsorP6_012735 [Peronosclerospora sorghi]